MIIILFLINFFWLLLFDFVNLIYSQDNFISIPFHLKKLNYSSNYNSKMFLKDFYNRKIFVHLKIGTPIQDVSCPLDQTSDYFLFEEEKSTNDDNNNYFPSKSSSLNNGYSGIIIDKIIFEEKNKSLIFQIKAKNYKNRANISYIPKIGITIFTPYWQSNYPNFFLNLKKNNIIKNLIWTIDYNNSSEGNFIIGEDLKVSNNQKYSKYDYYSVYFQIRYFIYFDSVYAEKESKYNLNSTKIFININSGFIVGPTEYKKLIDKIFFNYLINMNICQVEAIRYIFNNNENQNFHYYVYSCKDLLFNDYYNNFPKLVFNLKEIEYNFEFINKDLFIHINDKYYFLIIFLKDVKKTEEIWYFGEPFYKKFTFSIDFDAKKIGFYIDKNNNLKEDEKKRKKDKNSVIYFSDIIKIVILIIELVVIIILLFIAFYLGKKIKERKKRLNEIKDDNYEYITEKYLSIN